MVGQDLDALVTPAQGDWPRYTTPLRLGVMASGSGSNFEALFDATQQQLDATIELLVVKITKLLYMI